MDGAMADLAGGRVCDGDLLGESCLDGEEPTVDDGTGAFLVRSGCEKKAWRVGEGRFEREELLGISRSMSFVSPVPKSPVQLTEADLL